MKTGLVLEGGGIRGIFTAGVLDVLMEEGIEFDGAVGVSAGAAFGCNYKSRQPRRSIRYNLQYAKDPRYSSVRSLLTTGDLFNAQFCYHDIPEKLYPFDWKAFLENPMEFYLVCTDVETGEPVYHQCTDADSEWEMMEWFRASGSMPLVSRVVEVGGRRLLDGGIADSIPLRFMEEQGYERNLVILTRPADYVKKATPLMPVMRRALRGYPAVVEAIENRHLGYNETLAYVRQREAGRYALVIRPETDLDVGRVEHDRTKIRAAYKEGRRTARRLLPRIRRFLLAAKGGTGADASAGAGIPAGSAAYGEGLPAGRAEAAAPDVTAPVRPSMVEEDRNAARGPVRPSLVEDPALQPGAASARRAAAPVGKGTAAADPAGQQTDSGHDAAAERAGGQPDASGMAAETAAALPGAQTYAQDAPSAPHVPARIRRRQKTWKPGNMKALKQQSLHEAPDQQEPS